MVLGLVWSTLKLPIQVPQPRYDRTRVSRLPSAVGAPLRRQLPRAATSKRNSYGNAGPRPGLVSRLRDELGAEAGPVLGGTHARVALAQAPECESASNADPQADYHLVHEFACEFTKSAGSSSAPIVTPPNFPFVSLNQRFALPTRGVKLQCRFTLPRPLPAETLQHEVGVAAHLIPLNGA